MPDTSTPSGGPPTFKQARRQQPLRSQQLGDGGQGRHRAGGPRRGLFHQADDRRRPVGLRRVASHHERTEARPADERHVAHRLAGSDPVRDALDQSDRAVDTVQTARDVQHQCPEDRAQEVGRLGEALARADRLLRATCSAAAPPVGPGARPGRLTNGTPGRSVALPLA
jgi:hypothetical protein